MALELEGKIIKMLPEQTGEGKNGPWTKQDFVIETFGEFPKTVCFTAWNDRATTVQGFKIGTPVKVSFVADSREYQERWYTDLRIYRIDTLVDTGGGSQSQNQTTGTTTTSNVQDPPPPEPPEEEDDDLPF